MAGSLKKIAETTVSSAVASVTLTGIDSTYDVYMLKFFDVVPSTDGQSLYCRVLESGTPNTTANYDWADKYLQVNTTFANEAQTNNTQWNWQPAIGSATNESGQGIVYLFNFNNASEYSFFTKEMTYIRSDGNLKGGQGGGVFTSASSCNGVSIFMASGNIASGTFTLYGLKK
jgi:hypothetical protein